MIDEKPDEEREGIEHTPKPGKPPKPEPESPVPPPPTPPPPR